MSDELVFYTSPMSRGRMVQWMLEEVGAQPRVVLVNLEKGEQRNAGYLAVNPMGKLPALVARGVVITETPAIIAWLADTHPAAGLAPGLVEPARGAWLRWMFFGSGCLDAAIIDRALQRPTPERTGAIGYGTLERTLETLEQAVQPGPWLLGERFSAADLYIASQLGFAMMTKAIEPRPLLMAYHARAIARPAFARAAAACDAQAAQFKAGSATP
jgi:glutathione S-transferase